MSITSGVFGFPVLTEVVWYDADGGQWSAPGGSVDVDPGSRAATIHTAELGTYAAIRPLGAATCDDTPRPDCKQPGKASLLRKAGAGSRDKLIWKFLEGEATGAADLGDPTGAAEHAFCVYAGTAAALVDELTIAASSTLWKATSMGYKYGDKAGGQQGVQKIVLRAGEEGRTKVLVRGRGANLPDPALAAFVPPVTVQLVNGFSLACWESTFEAGDVIKVEEDLFKAKR